MKPVETSETALPFAHGIEIELQVIRKDGTWIRGEEILSVFDEIVSNAKVLLDKRIRSSGIESVKKKYQHSAQTEEGERGSRIVATYTAPDGKRGDYTLLGHDPNVTSLTWILEVATPPCTTLEELAWWVQTLIAISYDSLPRDSNSILVSTGLNPTQEYLKNLSFGEHHHILGPEIDDSTKLAVYNMIRNFIPHLIALSVNSPFENKRPSDDVTIDDEGRVRAPRCKKSIRLLRNTTQMGPTNQFEFVPHMTTPDREQFARHVNRSYSRMVDLYPFTNYGTVEIRIFDTQLSIPRRIGIALILQALAMKAKKMSESSVNIPDVGSESLAANREAALTAGLWGPFKPSKTSEGMAYITTYNRQISDDGTIDAKKRNRFLGDAVASMLYLIREELEEINAFDNPFMQALLVSVFGSEYVEPRTTGADFQLQVYAKSDYNMVVLLKRLADVTRECSTNWLYDPLEGLPHLPTWLCWWKGLEPEIVTQPDRAFAGRECEFSILVKNRTGRKLENLGLTYTVEDADRNLVDNSLLTIPSVEDGEIHVSRISFDTNSDITAYNVIAEIGFAGRQVKLASTINLYWMKGEALPRSTTQFADGKTPLLFSGQIETNYPTSTMVNCEVNVLAPSMEARIAGVTKLLEVEGDAVTHLDHTSLPPVIIPSDISQGVERCVIQFRILNEEGNVISDWTSKPFYVGFVRRGPQLALLLDVNTHLTPGELIEGEAALTDKQKSIGTGAKLILEYTADSGSIVPIDEFQYTEFVGGRVPFHWKVPPIQNGSTADRMGIIRAKLVDRGKTVAETDSDRFAIDQLTTRITIDSLRAPKESGIGNQVSGWLRIRRNIEAGDPAMLQMAFIYPDGDEHELLTQQVKQRKNLSLSFGPLELPRPRRLQNPREGKLVARILLGNQEMDSRVATIGLVGGTASDLVNMEFVGLPRYTTPDQVLQPTLQVTSNAEDSLTGRLEVLLEIVNETKTILSRDLDIDPAKTKMIPLELRVPVSSEMSTANLRAVFSGAENTTESIHRVKVKAIEAPLFFIEFSVLDEDGTEIPGLVARLSQILIHARVKGPRPGIENLVLKLRVMTRRDVVKEFVIPLDADKSDEQVKTVKWLTPPIDVVTGYYLDAALLQGELALPSRAVQTQKRQFTVY
jgi:hypothetical protein